MSGLDQQDNCALVFATYSTNAILNNNNSTDFNAVCILDIV